MPHVRRRHHPREPKELDRGARPVSGAQSVDGCSRSQEAGCARLSPDDPGHQALPAGLRSAAENCDVRPGAVRSDDGAIPALGSQSVVVNVRIPGGIAYITELRRRTDPKPAQASHGLRTPTPVRSKSATFLVATVRPCTRAVAAMRASRSERGFGT